MSCPDCELSQSADEIYWFRWKTANIALAGCRQHIGEVMQVLRDHIHTAPATTTVHVENRPAAWDGEHDGGGRLPTSEDFRK